MRKKKKLRKKEKMLGGNVKLGAKRKEPDHTFYQTTFMSSYALCV